MYFLVGRRYLQCLCGRSRTLCALPSMRNLQKVGRRSLVNYCMVLLCRVKIKCQNEMVNEFVNYCIQVCRLTFVQDTLPDTWGLINPPASQLIPELFVIIQFCPVTPVWWFFIMTIVLRL